MLEELKGKELLRALRFVGDPDEFEFIGTEDEIIVVEVEEEIEEVLIS